MLAALASPIWSHIEGLVDFPHQNTLGVESRPCRWGRGRSWRLEPAGERGCRLPIRGRGLIPMAVAAGLDQGCATSA